MNVINLGVTGVAGSGKDTLYNILSERVRYYGIEPIRLSLGDELRIELRDFCIKHYGIDPCNCTRAQKDSIRDLFVFHGNYRRDASKGLHWSSLIYEKMERIKSEKRSSNILFVIPDIRYDKHEFDDLYFIKQKLNGVLVHLSKYKLDTKQNKIFHPPANEQEKIFDPRLKKAADFCIEWPESEDLSKLNIYADIIIANLRQKYNTFFEIN